MAHTIPMLVGAGDTALLAAIDRFTALITNNPNHATLAEWKRDRTAYQTQLVISLLSQKPPKIDPAYVLEKCGFVDTGTAHATDTAELQAALQRLKRVIAEQQAEIHRLKRQTQSA
jgi:hypothetical protein